MCARPAVTMSDYGDDYSDYGEEWLFVEEEYMVADARFGGAKDEAGVT